MSGEIIFVSSLTLIFFGCIAWLVIHSRAQARRPPGPTQPPGGPERLAAQPVHPARRAQAGAAPSRRKRRR